MKTVLFVHQSADLYGSDKVLLDIVIGVRLRGYLPIVLLPESGPLADLLQAAEIETHVTEVAKLTRNSASISGIMRLPFAVLTAIRQFDRIVGNRKIDLVHSNTLATLGGALWARWRAVPHVWHIHEIVISPKLASRAFPRLVSWLARIIICNSVPTETWLLNMQPQLRERTKVVWNGICVTDTQPPPTENTSATIVVALVGRINRLKGQALLIDAATILWEQGIRSISYLIVGSPPSGQEHYLDSLHKKIAQSPARHLIELKGFTKDIASIWSHCDIAVVPSTEPESFGLVAIEAMAFGKPVIAAAHGGLLDIVADNTTGILVPPNNSAALSEALARLIRDPELRKRMGKEGMARQRAMFSLETQCNQIVQCYKMATEAVC